MALNVKFNWGSFCKLMCLSWSMHNALMVSLIFGYGGNDNKRILQNGVLILFAADKSPKRINVCTVCNALLGLLINKTKYWEHFDPIKALKTPICHWSLHHLHIVGWDGGIDGWEHVQLGGHLAHLDFTHLSDKTGTPSSPSSQSLQPPSSQKNY